MNNLHQADHSYMGYVFQGFFALILLLDAKDNESVSIETDDDVVLDGGRKTLYQLKHSIKKNPPHLTEKNVGFWKTINIWASDSDITSKQFIFVTSAEIASGNVLELLRDENSDRALVRESLAKEANRVLSEAEAAQSAKKKKIPHKERLAGCKAFQKLDPHQQIELIDRISIQPKNFNLTQIQEQVEKRLILVSQNVRSQIARRLREWWDCRVTEALTRNLPRLISKSELQRKISDLIADHFDNSLPDDYSGRKPAISEIDRDGIMEEQINLVSGGHSRIQRAKLARWQAMSQRQQWLDDDFSLAPILANFDEQLIDEWTGLFEPMCDDCRGKFEEILVLQGRELLDWSHRNAPNEITPIGFTWSQPYLVRGSYQQLADEIRIGWHPEFRIRLLSTEKKND